MGAFLTSLGTQELRWTLPYAFLCCDLSAQNRELQIMKMLNHTNICKLTDSFYEQTKEGVFLNLVLEYVPKNLYEVGSTWSKQKKQIPMIYVKVLGFYVVFVALQA
jgi:O-succinylbenzoate synthase